jgi:hypothetical protein
MGSCDAEMQRGQGGRVAGCVFTGNFRTRKPAIAAQMLKAKIA